MNGFLIGKKPDHLEILEGNKTYFFLIRGVVTQNLSNFSPEQVTYPKKPRNYYYPREVNCYLHHWGSTRNLRRVNRKTFQDSTASRVEKKVSGDPAHQRQTKKF